MINTPLIELIGATVQFKEKDAPHIAPMTFNVTKGEFIQLHGPTGSGKSLALKLICGLVKPTVGEVRIAGDLVNDYTERQRRELRRTMGIMVQEGLLLENHNVLENVMLPALAAEESVREARLRAHRALSFCGIDDLANVVPKHLSAGQRQLTCLARAVVNRPVAILADEPAANLDLDNAQQLMDLLGQFSVAGVSVIVASHLAISPQSIAPRMINLGGHV